MSFFTLMKIHLLFFLSIGIAMAILQGIEFLANFNRRRMKETQSTFR